MTMPFDPERGIHVFNSHSELFLRKDGKYAAVYDIAAGQTLRQFQEENLLVIAPELQNHPIVDKPTQGMSVGFNHHEKLFFSQTHGSDSLEKHIAGIGQGFRHRRGRLSLTEVAGGMILGAPETAAILLMHHRINKSHLPVEVSKYRRIFVDLFAGVPFVAGVATLGWERKLSLKPYPDPKSKEHAAGAVFIFPQSAVPQLT